MIYVICMHDMAHEIARGRLFVNLRSSEDIRNPEAADRNRKNIWLIYTYMYMYMYIQQH